MTSLASRVWRTWWFSSTKFESNGFIAFLLLWDSYLHCWKEGVELQVSLSVSGEETPETGNSLGKTRNTLLINLQIHEWEQTRNTFEQACKLASKTANAYCFSRWLLRLYRSVMLFWQCICTTFPPLPRINDPPFLESASLFRSQRMAMHKRDEACRFQSKETGPAAFTGVTTRHQNTVAHSAPELCAQIDQGFSGGINTHRLSISVGQMALLFPFEIVLIDAATVEHFSKKNWCLNNSLWALYLSNVEYWSWSQKNILFTPC